MNQEKVWDALYKKLTWKKENATLPNLLQGKKVIEMGVGTGKTLISILKQKPLEVYALDFSTRAVEKSKELFKSNAKIVRADARKIPFPDDYFDVVVCYYVLNNNLKKDREKIIREMRRVLKKGGVCIFEDFSIKDFRNRGKKHTTDKNTRVKKNKLICHFFKEEELTNLFKGFSKMEVKKTSFKPFRGRNEKRELLAAILRK